LQHAIGAQWPPSLEELSNRQTTLESTESSALPWLINLKHANDAIPGVEPSVDLGTAQSM
jgi:hypothetical protein